LWDWFRKVLRESTKKKERVIVSSLELSNVNKDILAVLIIVLAIILFLFPYLFSSPTPLIFPDSSLGTDLPREILPMVVHIRQAIFSTGDLPLWRPYLLSGAPLVGHPVAPLFYIPHWIVLLSNLPLAINIDFAFHIFWMTLGTYIYLRVHQSNRHSASIIGAFAFGLSPVWFAHIGGGHLPMVAAISWWPWIWLSSISYFKTENLNWILVVGIGITSQIMNHPQIAMISGICIGLISFIKFFNLDLSTTCKLVRGWGIALGYSLLLSSVHLLPFLQLLKYSSRNNLAHQELVLGNLPPPLIFNILFPPSLKYPEWFIYPGIGILILAIYKITQDYERKVRNALIVFFIGIILSLGSNTPAHFLLYKLVPGYSYLRISSRWWMISLFSLSVIASWGTELFIQRSDLKKVTKWLIFAIGCIYFFIGIINYFDGVKIPFTVFPVAMVSVLLTILFLLGKSTSRIFYLIFIIVFLDLWWVGRSLIRPTYLDDLYDIKRVAHISNKQHANQGRTLDLTTHYIGMTEAAVFNLRLANGYDSFAISKYGDVVNQAIGCNYGGYSVTIPPMAGNPVAKKTCPNIDLQPNLLDLLNVNLIITDQPDETFGGDLTSNENGTYIYNFHNYFRKVYGVNTGKVVNHENCIDMLPDIDLRKSALVEEPLPFRETPTNFSNLEWVSGVNKEKFKITTQNAGLLVHSETWAPGWKVYVDGVEKKVLRVNCAFQGVWVEEGDHEVVFIYEPDSYKIGLRISIITFLVTIVWFNYRVFFDSE